MCRVGGGLDENIGGGAGGGIRGGDDYTMAEEARTLKLELSMG